MRDYRVSQTAFYRKLNEMKNIIRNVLKFSDMWPLIFRIISVPKITATQEYSIHDIFSILSVSRQEYIGIINKKLMINIKFLLI